VDKITAEVLVFAVLCLTLIAIVEGYGGEGISAIAGLVTGGGAGYVVGKGGANE